MDYNEKRACQRCTYEAPITCAYFNADKFYGAKTINHSKNGMSIPTNIAKLRIWLGNSLKR